MLRPAMEVSVVKSDTKLESPSSLERGISFASDLYELTKPGIMVLLLISTACPMVLAAGGNPGFLLFLFTMLGGGLVSASASTMNCIWDKDIDAIMERTKNRAIPAGRVSPFQALVFSLFTGITGLAVLFFYVNPTAAFLSLVGHLFYVVIYTAILKRHTVQNIVIGGAAGAVPPLVGWAAVTGDLAISPWLLFLIIFLWTPPHFWALAINKNSDYQKANIPMLPVVSGEKSTVFQMLAYCLLLIPVSVWLVLADEQLGNFSLVVLTALSLLFTYYVFQLDRAVKLVQVNSNEETKAKKVKQAWTVFKFSLVYLALFFGSLVVDSTII